MATVKKVMDFSDAVGAWSRVAKWAFTEEDFNEEDEAERVVTSTSLNPMAFYYMDSPTERLVILDSAIRDEDGEALMGFYPVASQWFSVAPAGITETQAGIMIDTLSRSKDCVVRPLEKDDAIWAIGRVVESLLELNEAVRKLDN
jgi:hypothetical protein